MTGRAPRTPVDAADAAAIGRASRAVGLQIALMSSVLVLAVLTATLLYVVQHIPLSRLFAFRHPHETTIDVGGLDILLAGIIIGFFAILLAGVMSWIATRRAVRPLGEALRIQRAFVADASHELRTPLAVLDARLQLLQRRIAADDPSTAIIGELRRDTKTLIEIVNDLLESAEVGPPAGREGPVAVNPVVALAADSMRLLGQERRVEIRVKETAALATVMPAASIHRCVVALLDNAIDFAPDGSTIDVSVGESRGMVRIAVRDAGAGIQGIEPGRVFDRFARSSDALDGGGSARTGFGIGLALVHDTVERYGGTARVATTSSAGTEIELLIPRVRAA